MPWSRRSTTAYCPIGLLLSLQRLQAASNRQARQTDPQGLYDRSRQQLPRHRQALLGGHLRRECSGCVIWFARGKWPACPNQIALACQQTVVMFCGHVRPSPHQHQRAAVQLARPPAPMHCLDAAQAKRPTTLNADMSIDANAVSASANKSYSGTGTLYGVGYDQKFNETTKIRYAAVKYSKVGGESDSGGTIYSIGLVKNFE